MTTPLKADYCSECDFPLRPKGRLGRPRFTCSAKCAAARGNRLHREARAWEAQCRAADEANRQYLAEEAAFFRGVGR